MRDDECVLTIRSCKKAWRASKDDVPLRAMAPIGLRCARCVWWDRQES